MQTLTIIFSGIFGLIVGSFSGVVIWRMGTGRGVGGRSMCLSCNRTLHWYELIPLVSFIIQGGKCRKCKSKIPAQDFWVEIVTGALFALTAFVLLGMMGCGNGVAFVAMIVGWFILIATGIVISVYDLRHKLIHLPSLIAFFAVGVLLLVLQNFFSGTPVVILDIVQRIGYGLLVALPFFALWLVSRGKWIGFGDIEIMAIAGFLLGISGGFSAVIFGFWIACIVVLPIYGYYKSRGKTMHHEIPMGPFLLAGIWLVWMLDLNIFDLLAKVIQY